MFKIGEFSKLSQVSIRMLRHYDKIDLLVPKKTDKFTGYRYYSASQLIVINRIQELKKMGFSLNEIKDILKDYKDDDSFKNALKARKSEIESGIKRNAKPSIAYWKLRKEIRGGFNYEIQRKYKRNARKKGC